MAGVCPCVRQSLSGCYGISVFVLAARNINIDDSAYPVRIFKNKIIPRIRRQIAAIVSNTGNDVKTIITINLLNSMSLDAG